MSDCWLSWIWFYHSDAAKLLEICEIAKIFWVLFLNFGGSITTSMGLQHSAASQATAMATLQCPPRHSAPTGTLQTEKTFALFPFRFANNSVPFFNHTELSYLCTYLAEARPPLPKKMRPSMKKILFTLLLLSLPIGIAAQHTYTLDQCRELALKQNKQLAIQQTQAEKATYDRRAAGTNYLPKVSLTAGYLLTSQEISLLNDEQKATLSNLGTNLAGNLSQVMAQIVQQHPELAQLAQQAGQLMPSVAGTLNGMGQSVVDAFRTDTRNAVAGAVLLTQPLYMGGKIRAYNQITHYAEDIAQEKLRGGRQEVILQVDQAYWQVVSLANKERLAISYRDMLQQLNKDVEALIREGVATRANALNVNVKLNEAEMTLLKVQDGLTLSRMLLCQICGLPLESSPLLAEEQMEDLAAVPMPLASNDSLKWEWRPELRQLEKAVNIYDAKVQVQRSDYLPHLALMGGYATTYPSLVNGFEKRFRGIWNVGVTLKVPVWNWGEGRYKVRSAKAEAQIARLNLDEAREKVQLQVSQSRLRANEAVRKLQLSERNLEMADENLRVAQVGHTEGVVTTSDLLGAQTAWLQAHSERIDAQIDVMITRSILDKALGRLGE